MHLLRRNHYHDVSWQHQPSDPDRFRDHLTVAVKENQILEAYYPHALDAAVGRWPEERTRRCTELAGITGPYASAVADQVILFPEWGLWLALLGLAGGTGWLHARSGRDQGRENRTRFPAGPEDSSCPGIAEGRPLK